MKLSLLWLSLRKEFLDLPKTNKESESPSEVNEKMSVAEISNS